MRMAQTLWDYSVALVGGEETIYSHKRKLIESGANAALWALSGAPDFRLTYDTTCNTTALAFSRIVSTVLLDHQKYHAHRCLRSGDFACGSHV